MNKIKLINPKYTIDVFRDLETGNFYYNNGNNYFVKNDCVAGVHLFDILNDEFYNKFEIFEIANYKKIPNDIFIYFYDEETLRKAYYQGHKSGISSKSSITFNKFLETL